MIYYKNKRKISVILFLMSFTGCVEGRLAGDYGPIPDISQLEQQGNLSRYGLSPTSDANIEKYVREVYKKINQNNSYIENNGIEIKVADSIKPFAFSTNYGLIVISKGMIEILDYEDQIAMIIAHEIGHFQAGHHQGTSRVSPEASGGVAAIAGLAVAIVLTVASNGVIPGDGLAATILGSNVSTITGEAALLSSTAIYDSQREFKELEELEADKYALEYLVNTGYDPKIANQTWLYLDSKLSECQNENIDNNYNPLLIVNQHPSSENRFEELSKLKSLYDSDKKHIVRRNKFFKFSHAKYIDKCKV